MGGASSSTRGLFFGGNHGNKTIDFVTLASTGDAQDFGDITNDFGNTDPAAMASNGTISLCLQEVQVRLLEMILPESVK